MHRVACQWLPCIVKLLHGESSVQAGQRHCIPLQAPKAFKMSCVQAEAKGLMEDEGQRKERRRVDKFITLQVQQISATQQQAGHCSHPSKLCCPGPGLQQMYRTALCLHWCVRQRSCNPVSHL